MAFVNLSLLAGALLIAVPVAIHLVMQRKPQQFVFPAVRFVHARRETNRRQLQLRHWLLLALRCLAILLAAAALARPSVHSATIGEWLAAAALGAMSVLTAAIAFAAWRQQRGRLLVGALSAAAAVLLAGGGYYLARANAASDVIRSGDAEAPTAAAIILDTSPRMTYRVENVSRIEAAREMAIWLLRRLPEESEIAILDSRDVPAAFSIDRAAAAKAIERLAPASSPRSLPSAIEEALLLLPTSEKPQREIYVFTDRTSPAWKSADPERLARRLADHPEIQLHVIDVGVREPQNVSLSQLELPNETLARSSELEIAVQLASVGRSGDATIELHLEEPDPTRPVVRDGELLLPASRVRGSHTTTLSHGSSERVSFRLAGLSPGAYQGQIRLSGEDPLACDDTLYFACEIREPWPVLIVRPAGVREQDLIEAIAPYSLRQTNQARFQCRAILPADLASVKLEDFAVVCLLDPPPLPEAAWHRLAEYAAAGGAVATFLGHQAAGADGRIEPSFLEDSARKLLGGKLSPLSWRSPEGDVFLSPVAYDHPALAEFRGINTTVPWRNFPVFRHWAVEGDPQTRVILPFSNRKGAVLESPLGKGLAVVMTTPISDPLRPAGRSAWNEISSGEDAWPYFVFINELFDYLAERAPSRLNYITGEVASLHNRADRDPPRYQLYLPGDSPQEVVPREEQLVVRFTETPGAYRLRGQKDGPVVRGFAVNFPSSAGDLTPLPPEGLDLLLGKGRYRLARDREEIDRGIGQARIGKEFYPLLIVLAAAVLGIEQLLANRFYRPREKPSMPPRGE